MDVISTRYPLPSDDYKIMPLRHNWREAYRFSMEFKTDIIVSFNGKEQRRAVREYPRFSVDMTANLVNGEKLYWEYMHTTGGNRPVYAPLEFLSVFTTAAMIPEATTASILSPTFDVTDYWENVEVVLISDSKVRGVRETRSLGAVGDTSLTFGEDSLCEFAQKSDIAPAYLAQLGDDLQSSHLTSLAGTINLRLDFLAQNLFEIVDKSTPTFVGALEFFNFPPDWADGVGVSYQWLKLPVDFGYGIFDTEQNVEFPTRLHQANFTAMSLPQAYDLMTFFQRHHGMCSEFFFTTWENDIPFSFLSGGGFSILIDGTAFGYTYRNSTVYRRIMVRFVDGTVGHYQVDYVEVLPDTDSSVLRTTEPLPIAELSSATVKGISWVVCGRFAADRIDVDFLTKDKAEISLPIQTLENMEL